MLLGKQREYLVERNPNIERLRGDKSVPKRMAKGKKRWLPFAARIELFRVHLCTNSAGQGEVEHGNGRGQEGR